MTTPVYARGVSKLVSVALESSFGTLPAVAGQELRRVTSDLNANVSAITSQEILPSQQVRDARHGPQQVAGTISGQLSPQTYAILFKILLRNTFGSANVTTGAITDTSAVVTNGNLVVTSVATNFATGGFYEGDVIRMTGLTGSPAGLNGANFRIVAISGKVMTLCPPSSVTPAAWTTGQSVTFTIPGSKIYIPATGQSNTSMSVEHYYQDVGVTELFTGCVVNQIAVNVPPAGFVGFQASLIGKQMIYNGSASGTNFTSLTAPTTTTSLTGVGGQILYNGAVIAVVTQASVQIAAAVQADPVVGSNYVPAIFPGTVSVRGSLTALFPSGDTLTTDFLNENLVELSLLFTTSPAPGADFVSILMPVTKLMSSTKTDSDRAITRSFQFQALENTGQNANANLSTVIIQDSLQVTA